MENSPIELKALQVRLKETPFERSRLSPPLDLSIEYASLILLAGGSEGFFRSLMRVLAGLERPPAGEIGWHGRAGEGPGGKARSHSLAWLPFPGEEIFVGTTVREELVFPAAASGSETVLPQLLAGLNTVDPDRFRERSVWDLGSAERRLLLLAAQASHHPSVWLCCEPLGRMDGLSSRRVLELLAAQRDNGAAVVISCSDPAPIIGLADRMLVFTKQGELSAVFEGRQIHEKIHYDSQYVFTLWLAAWKERTCE